jgi:uncharacterized membrane protein YjdF
MEVFNHNEEKFDKAMRNFARLLFVALIIFELLNYLKILQFNLEYTWLGLIITSSVAFLILEIAAHKYKKIKDHNLHWIIWFIVVGGLSLDAAGDFFHLYGKLFWWDRVVHFFISAVACFTIFTVISAFWIDKFKFCLLFNSGKMRLASFLAMTSTISLSAIYEIEEYAEDLIFHTHRLGLGVDTADDLLFNTLGALSVLIILYIYYKVTGDREVCD